MFVAIALNTPAVVVVLGAADDVSLVDEVERLLLLLFEEEDEDLFDVLDVVCLLLVVVTLEVLVIFELDFTVVEVEEDVRRSTGSPKPYLRTGSGRPYAFPRFRIRNSSSISMILLRFTNRSSACA
jgi:hypothetical protein